MFYGRINQYIILSRVWNALLAAAVCVYSFLIAEGNFAIDRLEVLLLSLGIFFLVAFANAHNDTTDFNIDKINRPNRPLPSGKMSFKAAYIAALAWFFIAMILGVIAGFKFALLFAAVGSLCFTYNRFLKGLPLVGNFTVALLTTTPIIVPVIKLGLPQAKLFTLAFFAFMLTFMREITKDIEDINGDKALGLKTFPVICGVNLSLSLVFICSFQCLVLLALFRPFLLAAVAPCLALSAIFACLKKWRLSQVAIKITMLAGIAGFAIL
ncbi:MAG: geranylgeranylglycerol-phosphate geranylgeranyltransferase [Fibromonadaceae bacterium]|jgi:4-hydroxybenzoate polyprenyltransferase|nr:geranylgeranylglycerol-phosphate geranylgeranyltransferase [Fibromonadaceae bacterium]